MRRVWECRICKRWFYAPLPNMVYVSCLVNHSPDECCHYGDFEAPAPYGDYEAVP